ncbi:MAG: esterase/lipase family protein [Nitrospinota bacterium]
MFSTLLDAFFFGPLVFLTATTLMARWINPARKRDRTANVSAGGVLFYYCREYLRLLIYQLVYVTVAPAEYLYMKFNLKKEPGQKADSDKPAVVLIHGYISTTSHWLFQMWRLKRAGYEDVARFGYNPFTGSLNEWSRSLTNMLKERFPSHPVILAGHSFGGLIAIRVVSMMPEGSVEKVVTMGSPIEGTLMADFAVTPAARNLRRGTAMIEEIGRKTASLKTELICCWSRWDNIIVPQESAAPEGSNRVEIEGIGHSGYCFDPRVTRHITGKTSF